MSNDIKRSTYIRYFWGFLYQCFISIKSIEISVKKTKSVKSTKVKQI